MLRKQCEVQTEIKFCLQNPRILSTFSDLHSESVHGDVDMLPTPIIVPLNLQPMSKTFITRAPLNQVNETYVYGEYKYIITFFQEHHHPQISS